MLCKSATVPAAVNPVSPRDDTLLIGHCSIAGREGVESWDKSEDLPCAIGCLLLRRKGAPEVVAGGFSVRPYLLRPSFPVAANLFGQTFLRLDEEVVAMLCRVVMPVFACAVFSVKSVPYGRNRWNH